MAAGSGWFSSENIWLLLQKQCREPDNMSKVSVFLLNNSTAMALLLSFCSPAAIYLFDCLHICFCLFAMTILYGFLAKVRLSKMRNTNFMCVGNKAHHKVRSRKKGCQNRYNSGVIFITLRKYLTNKDYKIKPKIWQSN